jgi:hypothetical protein
MEKRTYDFSTLTEEQIKFLEKEFYKSFIEKLFDYLHFAFEPEQRLTTIIIYLALIINITFLLIAIFK